MAIALCLLTMDEEPLRHDQMKVILGAGHRDIKQAPLLLQLRTGAGAEIGTAPVVLAQHADHGKDAGEGGEAKNLANLPPLTAALPRVSEASIGHELTADALAMGFAEAVRAYKAALSG